MTSIPQPSSPSYSSSFATLNQKIKTLSTSGSHAGLSGATGAIPSGMTGMSGRNSLGNQEMYGGISGTSGSTGPVSETTIPSGTMSSTVSHSNQNFQYQTPNRATGTQSPLKSIPSFQNYQGASSQSQTAPAYHTTSTGLSFDTLNPYDMQYALNEWRNIQEIVRYSFVALVDQIKQQQMEIRTMHAHIKKQNEIIEEQSNILKSKATRAEVTLEVNKHLKELEQTIEGRASMVDVVSLLEQKMNKEEVHKLLGTKANLSDLKQISTEKADQTEVNEYLEIHTKDILEIKNVLTKKANTIEVVKELQKRASITDVQQALETKANVHDVQEALKHKANKQSVISALAKKISTPDLEAALTQHKSQMQLEFAQELASKVDTDQIAAIQNEITNIQNTTQQIRSQLDQKVNTSNMQSMLAQKANREDIQVQLDAHSGRLNASFKSSIDDVIQRFSTDVEVMQKKLESKAEEANLKRVVQIVKETRSQIDQKANLEHVREALQTKVSIPQLKQLKDEIVQMATKSELEEKLNEKANANDVESIRRELASRVTKESVGSALKKKVNVSDLNNLIEQYTDMQNLKKDMLQKANIKDVMELVSLKADSTELEKVSTQASEIITQCVNTEQFSQTLQEQAIINEALLSQNNMARWMWKNGKLKSGYGVPWNVQVINTSPENFLWEKDRVNIITVQPGLYEIVFGFYGKKTPTVQLHVNGEPILSTGVEGSTTVVYNKASKRLRQRAGAITGLTHIDYLALPEKARIAISYAGEQKGEGFLSLRKL